MKHIRVPPYGVHLYITTELAEFNKVVNKAGWDIGKPAGCAWHDGTGNFYVGVFDCGGTSGLATLVHELGHVMLDLCKHIQYDPSTQQEPFCYTLDYLLTQCLKACPEINK